MQLELMILLLFVTTAILIFIYKKLNEKKQFCIGIDINKSEKTKISESTGIVLLVPFWTIIFYFNYYLGFGNELFIYAVTVSIFALVGFFDDLQHKFLAKPKAWFTRALPIAVASLAFSSFFAPDILWIIPLSLFVAGIASLQNTFAGLNGWEVGSGFIISIFISFLLLGSQFFLMAISLSVLIFALLIFNVFPAKVFPGDSGTLFIGSSLSTLMVLTNNLELMIISFLLFLPHLIDFFVLKLFTNRFDPTQQKILPYKLTEKNSLEIPDYHDKKNRYDFAKLIIKLFGPLKERTIVLIIWTFVIANGLFWLFVFGKI